MSATQTRVALGLCFAVLLVAPAWSYDATTIPFSLESTHEQKFRSEQCHPMYAKSNIPGAYREATIQVIVLNATVNRPGDFLVAIYPEDDFELGIPEEADINKKNIICKQDLYDEKKCGVSNVGELILRPLHNTTRASVVLGSLVEDGGPASASDMYTVKAKGLHCIVLFSADGLYAGDINFEYPYGDLPPIKYPYLPFYGFVGVAYGIIGLVWMILCAYYWQNILQVQIYISGIIFLCMMEMTFAYAYFANWNDQGDDSDTLLAISCMLTAARSSISLVALLVVCLGYGLVKPTLGSTWTKVLGLGFINFVFGTMFTAEVTTASSPEKGPSSLLIFFVLPLAITLTIFYVWTLSALTETIAKLSLRRQSEKTKTYVALRRILVVSLVVLCVFTVTAAIQKLDTKNYKYYWDVQWFTNDCSLFLVYFFVFISVLFLWRPRANNIRAGVDQLATEDPDDLEDVELGRVNTLGTVGSVGDRVKSRRSRSQKGPDTEDEDPLKWVEDNIPDLLNDEENITQTREDQTQMLRAELSKMN